MGTTRNEDGSQVDAGIKLPVKDILNNAIKDRQLRPWSYYKFSNIQLCEILDKYADKFGSLDD